MSLSIKYLSNYPQFGSTAGLTNVDASSFSFTNGVDSSSYTGYVAGYIDGESRAKLFYTDGSTIALPKLVKVTQVSIVDAAGTTKTGGYYLSLGTWAPGSPDSASANSEIYLDQLGLIIAASTAYG
jgi:hypothetical protein